MEHTVTSRTHILHDMSSDHTPDEPHAHAYKCRHPCISTAQGQCQVQCRSTRGVTFRGFRTAMYAPLPSFFGSRHMAIGHGHLSSIVPTAPWYRRLGSATSLPLSLAPRRCVLNCPCEMTARPICWFTVHEAGHRTTYNTSGCPLVCICAPPRGLFRANSHSIAERAS
ncbi:hypothetical protein L226DRAFT_73305 [Lentinus tigrinus ALCF2SS1-7]|uniref:uncharacterized protein n=1 Tax=Lentinus tigrinus ALCF2SS1-7 TaxID=1328758 RepID=UPI0011660909|nr:hypothetical protein L226DRAFT_73305 [Lentinus tigrinus ALCF2SS1-7]